MADRDQGGPVPVEVICVPWSVGLRPNAAGAEPGTWRAPRALREAGIAEKLGAVRVTELPRPPYDVEAQPGTRVRNGVTLRQHSLLLADAVHDAIGSGRLPVVVGGDCSVLLGCLAGARRRQQVALVHIDGHADFAHPGNRDVTTLAAAAGMDLALATGRGELLLTHWPGADGPLVEDRQVVQIGDRTGADLPDGLLVIGIGDVLAKGVDTTARQALEHLEGVRPIWVHVDLDVLDGVVLPAVDSPGTPGLSYDQLAALLSRLCRTGRVLGVDVTIYDPELDPDDVYAPAIVDCITVGLGGQR